jgi:cysteinyl-tRNA synthetase
MQHIINYISELIKKGYAYEVDGDVYFRVSKIDDYGQLSNREVDDLISGSRVDVNTKKENPLDFTLWKKTTVGINFDSPFSKGRPGWHTECVAMIDDIFNDEIDIHGGGMDLKFPHHENEIAQAKATHNHRVARYWMHNGRLSFKDEKMSKSIGNVIFAKDVNEKMGLRYFLLSTHYRSPLNYTDEGFSMYVKEYEKLENALKSIFLKLDVDQSLNQDVKITDESVLKDLKDFDEAMESDFNTANAITSLQSLLKYANVNSRKKDNNQVLNQILNGLLYMIDILGFKVDLTRMTDDLRLVYQKWQDARKNKDFDEADKLRSILTEKGVI